MTPKTYQARGYCTPRGYELLDAILGELCRLGNAALQERRDAWAMSRTSISYIDQSKSLTLVRHDDPVSLLGQLNVTAARGALQRVDRAFNDFFRRCKTGEKPGYPRFQKRNRYKTVEINDVRNNQVQQYPGITLIKVNGLPTIRIHPKQPLPTTKPKAIRITRRVRGCTVSLVYDHEPTKLRKTGESVGVDVGNRKRATLSTGEHFAPEEQDWPEIRRAQRAIARSTRGSNRRRKRIRHLQRIRRRQAVRSRNACHRMTSSIVQRFDVISIEDLQIGNMTASAAGTVEEPGRNVAAKAGLNRDCEALASRCARRLATCRRVARGRRFGELASSRSWSLVAQRTIDPHSEHSTTAAMRRKSPGS